MYKILPVIFLTVVIAVVGSLDFILQRQKHAGQPFGITEYISARKADYAAFSQPPSLGRAMPQELAGWDVHAFELTDLPTLYGRAITEQELQLQREVRANEDLGMRMTSGVGKIELMMVKGQTSLVLTGIHLEENGSMQTDALKKANSFMKMLQTAQAGPAPVEFARVDGVVIEEIFPAEGNDSELRSFRATLPDALVIRAATRSTDDAAITEALSAVDFVMLNKLLAEPMANITDSSATTMAEAEPVAEDDSPVNMFKRKDTDTEAGASEAPAAAESTATKICVLRAGKLECPK